MSSKIRIVAQHLGRELEGFESETIAELKHPELTTEALRAGVDLMLIDADEHWKKTGLHGVHVLHARYHGDDLIGEFRDAEGKVKLKAKGGVCTRITGTTSLAPEPMGSVRGSVGTCVIEAGTYDIMGGVYIGVACGGRLIFFIAIA